MVEIKWTGKNEADCIANFERYTTADPNAKYYQHPDGYWVIEASAVKINIPAVAVDGEDGKPVLMTEEEHATWKVGQELKT